VDEKLWVVNASPIITLAKVEHLDLLSTLAPEFCVPEPVAEEILAGPLQDPARQALHDGWGNRRSGAKIPKGILEWGLGAGESAVLAACLESEMAVAVVDDADARKCAQVLGIPVLGTLGVVIRAKLRGLIPSAADVIRRLTAAGLHLESAMVTKILREIGEDL
jgi:predicted nucleic acid-binding protein